MIDHPNGDDPNGDDPLGALVGFADVLRSEGFTITVDRISFAVKALAHWSIAAGADPYWPLRVAFCTSQADLLRFDALYQSCFQRPMAEDASKPDPQPVLIPAQSWIPGDEADPDPGAQDQDAGAVAAGDATRLATRDFEDMTESELLEVSAWVDLLRPVPPRRAMRQRPFRSGHHVDPARTMRLMLRHGGELLRIRYRRPAPRPRRVLLLVDVSASMRPYSDVLLRFAYAAHRANPGNTEVFAVGTRHTRLTGPLSTGRPEAALAAAGKVETDWFGGTRLGTALRDFLSRWGGSRAVRSAIVILGSDGFEFSALPTLMIAQVARLAGLADTFIWVDPSHGIDGRVVDRHLGRAQAHATTVLGCHNYEALREVAKVITNA